MTFQTTVRDDQAGGIIGEIIYDGPTRVKPLTANSSGATPNTIGKAFTYVGASDTECAAGSAGAGAFAGILAFPKEHASIGTVAGTLVPTLDLPDNTEAQFMTMGIMIVNISVFTTGAIGDGIFYVDATGLLGCGVAAGGQTQIANAKIDRKTITGVGLAIITLTEAE